MAIEPIQTEKTNNKTAEQPVFPANAEKMGEDASRFGPAYVLGQSSQSPASAANPAAAKESPEKPPIDPTQEAKNAAALAESRKEEVSRFGPAYVLQDHPPSKQVMTVPFTPTSVGKTLAALPPINPIGTASLTRLSLAKLLQGIENNGSQLGKNSV